jgi:hypothetical protein
MNIKKEENNWYVYLHRKPNCKTFYVGIGKTKKRLLSSYSRNKYWINTVKKNNNSFYAQIVFEDLSKVDACELEVFLIETYGVENLTNMTLGGETGVISNSKESREKMKKSHAGVKLLPHHVKAIQESRNYGKNHFASREVKCSKTGVVYESVTEAALMIGMKMRTLHAQLSGENKNKTTLTY